MNWSGSFFDLNNPKQIMGKTYLSDTEITVMHTGIWVAFLFGVWAYQNAAGKVYKTVGFYADIFNNKRS